MSEERLQILRMVQEGKLSPEEASRLLEAVEPAGAGGPKAKHVRVVFTEGAKTRNFTLSMGLAKMLLSFPGSILRISTGDAAIDQQGLMDALVSGKPGKIFEGQDGRERIEIWLDA